MVVVVVVVVVEVVEVVVIEVVVVEVVVVLAEAVAAAVVVVLLLGGSEVPCDAEPEDDAEGAVSAEPAVSALGTGSTRSVPGAAGAKVVVMSVVSGRATVSVVATVPTTAPVVAVSGLLSPPEEQAEAASPKTAAKAATETDFVCLIPKKPLTADSGFIF